MLFVGRVRFLRSCCWLVITFGYIWKSELNQHDALQTHALGILGAFRQRLQFVGCRTAAAAATITGVYRRTQL